MTRDVFGEVKDLILIHVVSISVLILSAGVGCSERENALWEEESEEGGEEVAGGEGDGEEDAEESPEEKWDHGSGEVENENEGGEPSSLACPENDQEILVIDFRSGWWSGGGGTINPFSMMEGPTWGEKFALPTMHGICDNIGVEYHHFEIDKWVKLTYPADGNLSKDENGGDYEGLGGEELLKFLNRDLEEYTQLWILSGSNEDPADIATGQEFVSDLVAYTKGLCTPVLIGAGDGFVDHANTFGDGLGLGQLMEQVTSPPGFFKLKGEVTMRSQLKLESHVLFDGVETVANEVEIISKDDIAPSDKLLDNTELRTIATDQAGASILSVGNIGGDRPVILDSGFQRYYVGDKEAGTKKLLENTVLYLSLVGCFSVVG